MSRGLGDVYKRQGEQWAWKPDDKLKSEKECIHTLLQTVGGDGNLLFNVGPMPDGRIEARQVDILAGMGRWLSINGEAVYGTQGGPYLPGEAMVSTHKGNKIYLHLLKSPGKKLRLPIDKGISVKSAHFLNDNTSLEVQAGDNGITVILPKKLPDEIASVIVLTLDRPASEINLIKL